MWRYAAVHRCASSPPSRPAQVRVAEVGAAILSFRCPDREGKTAEVSLGAKDAADLSQRNPAFLGVIVGRIANRVAGAAFCCEGKVGPWPTAGCGSGGGFAWRGSSPEPRGFGRRPRSATPWRQTTGLTTCTVVLKAFTRPSGGVSPAKETTAPPARYSPCTRLTATRATPALWTCAAARPYRLASGGSATRSPPIASLPSTANRHRELRRPLSRTRSPAIHWASICAPSRLVCVPLALAGEHRWLCLTRQPAQATTPLALTSHAYWNLSGDFTAGIRDHVRARGWRVASVQTPLTPALCMSVSVSVATCVCI